MSRPWTQAFARLALAAMLALVLTPSLGRFAQASAGPGTRLLPMPMSLPTSTSMPMAAPAAMHGEGCGMADKSAGEKAPAPMHPGQGDCAYCPLLSLLALPDARLLAVPALHWPQAWASVGSLGRQGPAMPSGLGARGPPMPASR